MANDLYLSPADVIRYLLIELELGTNPEDNDSWPVFAASEPNVPDNCITVYDTAGQMDGRTHVTGEVFEHYGLQFRIRSQTAPVGRRKADELRRTLSREVNWSTVLLGDYYYTVQCLSKFGPIIPLGLNRPVNKCHLHTFNALCLVKAEAVVALPVGLLVDEGENPLLDQDGNYLLGA